MADYGFPEDIAQQLLSSYGTEIDGLLSFIDQTPALAQPLVPNLPLIRAQVIYAMRQEMALTVEDVLNRRLHSLVYPGQQRLAAAEAAGRLMADELGWSEEERTLQRQAYYRTLVDNQRWRGKIDLALTTD
jgi:glycerol-3-phosphate dehydrogenase